MVVLIWPPFPVTEISWDIAGEARSGGRSVDGTDQRVAMSGGGYWTAQLSLSILSKPNGIRIYRALKAAMDGGATAIEVLVLDTPQQPWPAGFGGPTGGIAHSDDTPFSDGTGYVNSNIVASVLGNPVLRATALLLAKTAIADLQGGEYFSIRHPTEGLRLYVITAIVSQNSVQASVQFRPPLREAADSGTVLDFAKPGCLMRLDDPSSAALRIGVSWIATPTIKFEEYE